MSKVPTQEQEELAEQGCTLSMGEHVEAMLTAMSMLGIGFGCETGYQALLVIAEVAKQLHDFSDFDPKPTATAYVQEAQMIMREREAARRAEANGQVFIAPGNDKVH